MKVGDHVFKVTGDYIFKGVIVAAFHKLDGHKKRLVVENPDGVLMIFSEKNLRLVLG